MDSNSVTGQNPVQKPAGAAFTVARERQKLSIETVHERLRISPRQIEALETDNFAALPEPMITRGFIRNYARLLGVDAEPVLTAYQASLPETAPHAINPHSENIVIAGADRITWRRYIMASALVAILLGAWLIYDQNFARLASLPASSEVALATLPAETQGSTASLPVAMPPLAESAGQNNEAAPLAGTAPVAEAAVVQKQPRTDIQPAAAQEASAATARLKLSFVEESWVSVTDRNGNEIFNKTGVAGSEDSAEGMPPFSVVIGNATGTRLVYNDKPVDLSPYAKLNVARFTLE